MRDIIGVSLDMSRKATGVVLWKNHAPSRTQIVSLPDGYLGQQLVEWEAALERDVFGLLREPPAWVAYEDVRAVSKQHGMIQFGMVGVLMMWAWRLGVPVLPFAQATVKKALTGRGNAKKPEMMAAAQERWPDLKVTSHDVADALGVGLAFLAAVKE